MNKFRHFFGASFLVCVFLFSCEIDKGTVYITTPNPDPPLEVKYANVNSMRIFGFFDLIPRGLSGQVIVKYRAVGEEGEVDEEDLQQFTLTEDGLSELLGPINIYSVEATESCSYWMRISENFFSNEYLSIRVDKWFYPNDEPHRYFCDVRSIVVTQEAWEEAVAGAGEDEEAQITVTQTSLPEMPGNWGIPSPIHIQIPETVPAITFPVILFQSDGIAVFEIEGASSIQFDTETKKLTLSSASASPWLSDIRKIVITESAFLYGTTKITVEHSAIGAGRQNAQFTEFTAAGEHSYPEGIRIYGMTRFIGSESYVYTALPDNVDTNKILTLD
jgi:hypothetical protein